MRKLFMFNMVSVDGFFSGPAGELDWHNVDAESNEFAVKQLDEVDTLLFGRVTWEMMAAYWPTPAARKNDPVVAGRMNALTKVVGSRTLTKAEWQGSRLVRGDAAREVAALKARRGKDIALFGSARLGVSLMGAGLIDELRIMVNPVALGAGRRLFAEIGRQHPLKLLSSKAFRSGNVLLVYDVLRS
jgi:dihydrofolate reductase